MPKCGDYDLDKAIGWGRHATFFSARANGFGGESLIVIRRARLADKVISQHLLRAAAEQAAAVECGCEQIAPVLGFDLDDDGFAFYATVRYEWSLAEFLESGCKVDGTMLRKIISGTLLALHELNERFRRSHGNLTPGNVLLDKQGRVFLTDIGPSGKDATASADLFFVGKLIYQLVRCTLNIGTLNPPVEYTPDWPDSLGDEAPGWHEFTNRLLSRACYGGTGAIKSAMADLAQLSSLVPKGTSNLSPTLEPLTGTSAIRPRKRSRFLQTVALVLLAAGIGGFAWFQFSSIVKKDVTPPTSTPPSRFEALEALKLVLNKEPPPDELTENFNKKHALEGGPKQNTNYVVLTLIRDEVRKDPPDLQKLASLHATWTTSGLMDVRAAVWEKKGGGWVKLARELNTKSKIDLTNPKPAKPFSEQYIDAIRAWNDSNMLETKWGELTNDIKNLCTNLASKEDGNLLDLTQRAFTQFAENELLPAKDLAEANSRTDAVKKALGDFPQKQPLKNVQLSRFRQHMPELLKELDLKPLTSVLLALENEARLFQKPDEKVVRKWDDDLDRAEKRISKLRPDQQEDSSEELAKIFAAKMYVIASESDTVGSMIAELDKRLNALRTPEETEASNAYKIYMTFLESMQASVKRMTNLADVETWLQRYKDNWETFEKATRGLPEYHKTISTSNYYGSLKAATATSDAIRLNLPGWKQGETKPGASFTTARYERDGDAVTIPFILLGKPGAGTQPRYAMAAYETPLKLARLSRVPLGSGDKIRDGPKTWNGKFAPSNDWKWGIRRGELAKPTGPYGLETSGQKQPYLADGLVPHGNFLDMLPVTWVSFETARNIAAELGGQIPTVEQFKEASDKASASMRLRGDAWDKQYNRVQELIKTVGERIPSVFPNSGSFAPTGTEVNPENSVNDKVIWLNSVKMERESDEKFHHLIGNAAEWVTEGRDPKVIGGSVVSPPSVKPREPVSPDPMKGYFDVTFRLVVPVTVGEASAPLEAFKKVAAGIKPPLSPDPR